MNPPALHTMKALGRGLSSEPIHCTVEILVCTSLPAAICARRSFHGTSRARPCSTFSRTSARRSFAASGVLADGCDPYSTARSKSSSVQFSSMLALQPFDPNSFNSGPASWAWAIKPGNILPRGGRCGLDLLIYRQARQKERHNTGRHLW